MFEPGQRVECIDDNWLNGAPPEAICWLAGKRLPFKEEICVVAGVVPHERFPSIECLELVGFVRLIGFAASHFRLLVDVELEKLTAIAADPPGLSDDFSEAPLERAGVVPFAPMREAV